jgi:hypothetical protein
LSSIVDVKRCVKSLFVKSLKRALMTIFLGKFWTRQS